MKESLVHIALKPFLHGNAAQGAKNFFKINQLNFWSGNLKKNLQVGKETLSTPNTYNRKCPNSLQKFVLCMFYYSTTSLTNYYSLNIQQKTFRKKTTKTRQRGISSFRVLYSKLWKRQRRIMMYDVEGYVSRNFISKAVV